MCFMFRQLTCNVIERVGFKSTILLAPFCLPHLLWIPFPVSYHHGVNRKTFKYLCSDTLTLHPDDQTLVLLKGIFFQMCELFVCSVDLKIA